MGETSCPSCAMRLPWWVGWLRGAFMCPNCSAVVRGRRSKAWLFPPSTAALAVVVWGLAAAGFRGDGAGSLAVFLTAPVALVLIGVNAWLFPLELELLRLPPDPIDEEEGSDDVEDAAPAPSDNVETPAPWAPRLQTIEPPITFAGAAITVLIVVVSAYHAWMAIDTVVTRFTAHERQVLTTGNLPIRTELGEHAIEVTNVSDVIWNCMLIVPGAGTTVTHTVQIPPRQTQTVAYGVFATRDSGLTPRQVSTFARERLSATCEDPQGTVRVGNLR